ncbi:Thioesterase/thiol ester dehydrase-isomerase [Martensiomyces pterosporus]|nr:Thioesterase/thiol ester dehydrase-isomerase [Martensiomyces pterosporus]
MYPVAMAERRLDIRDMLELEEVGGWMYASKMLWSPPAAPIVFGGQLVGLSLAAGFRTVDNDFIAHSLHTQFLRRVDKSSPVEFKVTELSSGCNFVSRTVDCFQNKKPVMHMICNFTKQDGKRNTQHEYQKQIPDIALPESEVPGIPSEPAISAPSSNVKDDDEDTLVEGKGHYVLDPQGYPYGFPAEIWVKELDKDLTKPAPPKQHMWLRCPSTTPRQIQFQQCILATYSDLHFTRVIVRPFGIRVAPWPKILKKIVSIDHHIWFHKLADPSDFILVDTWCSQFSSGRGIVQSEMYSEDGQYVASVVQEGRVEIDPAAVLPAPKL